MVRKATTTPSQRLAASIGGTTTPAEKKAAARANAPAVVATAHQTASPDQLQPIPTPDGTAQIIAALMLQGKTLAEAQAMIANTTPQNQQAAVAEAAKGAKKIISQAEINGDEKLDPKDFVDPGDLSPIVDVDLTPRKGLTMIETLYAIRKELEGSKEFKRWRLPAIVVDDQLFAWLLYAVIQEAQFRGVASFGIENFIVQKMKEMKSIDPTQGGQRKMSRSGPAESFNGQNGGWGNQ